MFYKPLGKKCYGSIPHLPNSRLGEGDHHCHEGQSRIATKVRRDKNTIIVVQEKVDGSNVGVVKLNGEIIPLTRSGYVANTSKYLQHRMFYDWVIKNIDRFDNLLKEGERACGEWLVQAHGTKYKLPHEPFVLFDIIKGYERIIYQELKEMADKEGFITPNTIHIGDPLSVKDAMKILEKSSHGALDPVEGAVWRIEKNGKVECLVKYVRPDKDDGKYFPENNNGEIIWNEYYGI